MPQLCYLQKLTLTDFRNYAGMSLEARNAPVVLYGTNGSGKTNLLEAISLLSPGRGMRKARLSELCREGDVKAHPWAVVAEAETNGETLDIATGFDASAPEGSEKRIVRIAGKGARSQNALAEYLTILWLTPAMDQLFLEGGSVRRRFLDRLVYGFEPEHAARVSAYERAMRERNRLLSEHINDAAWLTALEARMVEAGAAIAASRVRVCERLTEAMAQGESAFPKAELSINGLVEDAFKQGNTATQAEALFAQNLEEGRREDGYAGRTKSGIHRSEFSANYIEKNMDASQCSTGEQKALLLSIMLAEARALSESLGKLPLLLLDEVASHLDEGRRASLFSEIFATGAQAWLTGTDRNLFARLEGEAAFFNVMEGRVYPV